jgi:hypothetical protein
VEAIVETAVKEADLGRLQSLLGDLYQTNPRTDGGQEEKEGSRKG